MPITRQKFLTPDTQVYATRHSIQRNRRQCAYWKRNGNYAQCELKKEHCRPSVCCEFMEIIGKEPAKGKECKDKT